MCGIAGFVTTEKGKAKLERAKFVANALLLNTLRGADSTGLFYVPHNAKKGDQAGWIKNALSGPEFMNDKEYDKIMDDVDDYSAVVCHNRAATIGKVSTETAHPFQEGPVTLVHNGTLDTTFGLPKAMHELNSDKKEGDSKIEVDSHVICHNLSTDSIEKVIGGLWGAFALVWHDARENSLYIIRNDRRPLHITSDLDSNTAYFMSEAEMLSLICKRNSIRIGPIFQPEAGVLLRFDLSGSKLKPIAKKLKLGVQTYYDTGWTPANGGASRRPFTHGTTSIPPPTATTSGHGIRNSGIDRHEDRIYIGGKLQTVPTQAQEMLFEYGMFTTDRFLMRPIEAVSYRHMPSMGMVIGEGKANEHPSVTFLMHSVNMEMWQDRKGDLWAVKPIGIKHETPDKFFVICKPVAMHTDRSRDIVWQSLYQDPASKRTRPTESMVNVRVPGPRGEMIPLEAFRDAVSGGCYHCGKPISVVQASSLMWVDSYTRPLCAMCQQDWISKNSTK